MIITSKFAYQGRSQIIKLKHRYYHVNSYIEFAVIT